MTDVRKSRRRWDSAARFSARESSMVFSRITRQLRLVLCAICMFGWTLRVAGAGEVVTQDGFRIRGIPVAIPALTPTEARKHAGNTDTTPIYMVDDGMRRTYVSKQRVPKENINRDADLDRYETFRFDQPATNVKQIGVIGGFKVLIPFNEHGRRTIQIKVGPEKTLEIVQGITEINPFHVKVVGVNYKMGFALSTTSFRPNELEPIIRTQLKPDDPAERLAVARFYLQSEQPHLSLAELDQIRQEFPDHAEKIEQFRTELVNQVSSQLLRDLADRQAAGQHQMARIAALGFETPQFQDVLKPEIKQEVREIVEKEDEIAQTVREIKLILGDLQAQLPTSELRTQADLPRTTIVSEIDAESLSRLQSFLTLQVDESLSPQEKLALAFSGWILGSENAQTDFPNTIRLWEARRLVLEYLREPNPLDTPKLLQQIESTEGVGPKSLAAILKYLPPVIETPEVVNGQIKGQMLELETVESGSDPPTPYTALLPIEYSPAHDYPLIVELRPAEYNREQAVKFWGGSIERPEQSQRRGYIVIAPEYLEPGKTGYDYSVDSHRRIRAAMVDAMHRFRIDSDRVFLAGHAMGADAAYDFGMAHPDLFAGVIAVSGYCRHHCEINWDNDRNLSLYAVGGELDRDTLAVNAGVLDDMIRFGRDAIFVEYIGRGYEDYYEEIHRFYDWMALKRRNWNVTEIRATICRPSDNRLYWLEGGNLGEAIFRSDPSLDGAPVTRLKFDGTIMRGRDTQRNEAQTVHVQTRTGSATIWLYPEVFNFEIPIKVQGRRRSPPIAIPQPNIEVMLEDYKRRADRNHIAWGKIVVE